MEHEGTKDDPVTFSVVVPRELADRLTAIAEARGAKRSQFARVLLAEGAARHERVERIAQALDPIGAAV
jgi:hypothetical protein